MDESTEFVDPNFAHQVSTMLDSGDFTGALALAQLGVDRYPWYPTGLLMLSRCFEAADRPLDALLAMRKVESILPDAPLVKEALARLEASQTQSYEQSMVPEDPSSPALVPPEPENAGPDTTFIEHQEGSENPAETHQSSVPLAPEEEAPDTARVEENAIVEPQPERMQTTDHPGPGSETAVPDTPMPEENDTVEDLAERLHTAAPLVPGPLPKTNEELEAEEWSEPSIVSPTVAEIFMQQGEYGEALRTYRKIVSQRPEEYGKYAARMEEIEEMIRRQLFG